MRLTRRQIISSGSMALVCAAAAPIDEPGYVEVKTGYGRVRGLQRKGLAIFKGVPYAGSISGARRFKAAPPLKPWTGVRDTLALGAPSIQPGQRRNEPAADEDCLFLNIWTPATDGRKRPVMFYSHGGGFTTGSGGAAYQDGANLASTWD